MILLDINQFSENEKEFYKEDVIKIQKIFIG